MKAVGIDIGSLTTKVAVLNGTDSFSSLIEPSGEEPEASARSALKKLLGSNGALSDTETYLVSTGIGGKGISFNQNQKAVTTCLARGINHIFPSVRLVIDMGAESTTVMKINQRGRPVDWANHDKCAAGTGLFLQQMAKLMQMSLEDMAEISMKSKTKADITGTCAVFAESEVISHVHRVPPTRMEDIAAGIFYSMVSRIMGLCKRVGIEKDVALTGGVARSKGLINILEKELGFKLLVPDEPQTVVALGAAIIARENIEKGAS